MQSRSIAALVVLISGARTAGAQWGVWQADSLLAAGRIQAAESAYYAAVRYQPRDPRARAALGRYLAARGAARVGAVLLEEARRFGGDSVAIGTSLATIYARAGDYKAVADLRPDVVPGAARRRAQWLSEHAPVARFRDTVAIVTYRPLGDGRGIGTVLLRVGKSELPAVLDPRVSGLQLPAAGPTDVRIFGAVGDHSLGVLPSFRIGGVEFDNVPVTMVSRDESVRLGFDVIAPYMPSFDPVAGMLTLRRVERGAHPADGSRVPALYDGNGLRLLIGGQWYPSSSGGAALLLASRRWTWDARRGDVVLMP